MTDQNPEPDDLPARLEAVLTERYTELGNPFSEMRRHEQGPDGWPASHPVGPHGVAEVLRELLACPAAVSVPPPADQTASGSGRAAEAELYVLLRKAGEPRHEAQALIDRHRAEVLRRVAAEEQPAETQDSRSLMRAHAALAEQAGRDQRALARIRQMADAWEQRLPEVIRTPAVVSAIRSALPDETDRPKLPPMDPVHILGIDAAPERPAVGEQPETQEAP